MLANKTQVQLHISIDLIKQFLSVSSFLNMISAVEL